MTTKGQNRLLHGVLIPQFLKGIDMEVTRENVLAVKGMFKKYLDVPSTSSLSDKEAGIFMQAFLMLSAREFGVELTEDFAKKTMKQILREATDGVG